MSPPFQVDPEIRSEPGVPWCHILPAIDSVAICKKPWDRQHTVLGYAVCAGCYEAISEP